MFGSFFICLFLYLCSPMYFLYNILILIAGFFLKIIALFNNKINLFVEGRKNVISKVKSVISTDDNDVIWFHCASLGEFEQGRPIIEKLKKKYPTYKLVLTFFSPSGYEIRKNYEIADVVTYLPLDTNQNVKNFLDVVHPKVVVIVKYEFWPNLLKELKNRKITTVLISGIFRENQLFFKWYGKWFKKMLATFTHIFVQDDTSETLLKNINFNNVTNCGDTRFDRVFEITQLDNKLDFIDKFKGESKIIVAGSTWKEDEELLVYYINNHLKKDEKVIIAPHNIKENDVINLKRSIKKNSVLFSEKDNKTLNNYQVFIVDTIGILTKIYSYATMAYVGGGYTKSGIHNILEPASFGVPIVIGPNYQKFKEAKDLLKLKSAISVDNQIAFNNCVEELMSNKNLTSKLGNISYNYVINNKGATLKIINYLNKQIN